MPRAKPKVERQCLVCDVLFMGTPAATRCETCKSAGLKVPRERQVARRRKPDAVARPEPKSQTSNAKPKTKAVKPTPLLITKTCGACGVEFETHKPKALRCNRCITENRKVKYKSCISCGVKFAAPFGDEYQCPSCAEQLGINQAELTPEQREALKAEETLAKWKNKVLIMQSELDERSNAKPKGTRKMSNKTKNSSVGVAWLELCARDGQVSSLSQLHERDIDEDTKLRLVMAFTRLRLKGYALDALATLCPVHLMSLDEDRAITDLPLIENPTPPTPQQMAEIELGLC